MKPFSLSQVFLQSAWLENALAREVDYLTSFDADRLLVGFRETAGLDTLGKERYGGWERSLIAGHTLGHYLAACAQGYANMGVPAQGKARLYALLTRLTDGLQECQRHSRGKPGFLFGATVLDEGNVELQFDNVEKRKTDIFSQAWVPWYTMHKLIAGLISVYEFAGYAPALAVAEGLGEWTYARSSQWSEEQRLTVLATEYGGMNDCLYSLYALTGNERFAIAAHRFDETALFEKVLSGEKNVLNNRHANTTIPKFLGAVNRYVCAHGKAIDGQTVDATRYLRYGQAFFETVAQHHSYVTGGNSEWEHFGEDDVLDAERTNCNNESCNIHNMLKLARMLYLLTGQARYLDFYENAYINSILASQNPETGMTMYFQPMASGYFKVYSTPYESFWCCTGSGMENFTKLNDSVYFHTDDTVVISLYLTSTLTWPEKELTLRMRSALPEGDAVLLDVEAAASPVHLALRVPEWCEAPRVTRNGEVVDCPASGDFLTLHDVRAGDAIVLTLPMRVTAHPLPDNPASMAFRYGPVVLSADLGVEQLTTTYTGVDVLVPASPCDASTEVLLPEGVSLPYLTAHPEEWLTREGDGLGFRLRGTDYVLTPHYRRYRERYALYFQFLTPEAAQARQAALARETLLDTVQPGYGQYESDALHAMRETNTLSATDDGTWRCALAGGSFAYRMKVNRRGGNALLLILLGADSGKTLQIACGGETLFAQRLTDPHPTYQIRVPIPDALAATAETIHANGEAHEVLTFTFSGVDGAPSARVCDFIRMLHVRESDQKG